MKTTTKEDIVASVTEAALRSYPNANGDELTAVSLLASNLERRNADWLDTKNRNAALIIETVNLRRLLAEAEAEIARLRNGAA